MERCYGCGVDYATLALGEPCPCKPPEVYYLSIRRVSGQPRPETITVEAPPTNGSRRHEQLKSETQPQLLIQLEEMALRLGARDGWVHANALGWTYYNGNNNIVGMKLAWARKRGDVERSKEGPPYMWRIARRDSVDDENRS